MTYEYQCPEGHISEVFGIPVEECDYPITCSVRDCNLQAHRVLSLPQGIALYGSPEGYTKPSATKRHSTKLINAKGNDIP